MKHLVFLRLAKAPIGKLPDSITCLKKLEILDLSECYPLSELPYDLNKMTSFDISGSEFLSIVEVHSLWDLNADIAAISENEKMLENLTSNTIVEKTSA
jgi:hypothetical protein